MIQKPLSVEEICNKLRPVFGKKVDEIYFQYTIAESREDQEEIAHILNALYQKNLHKLLDKGVLLEPPQEEVMNGTYQIANISYAGKEVYPFNLREQDWPRHICITGMSGSGKTTLAFKIVEALNKNHKPYLIFDWKKSFRPLISQDPTILNFTIGEEKVSNLFKMNINEPPQGVEPKEWIGTLVDLLTESFSASFGVHKVLLETLDEAFKEWGIYSGSNNYPTWNHIKWRIEEKMSQKTDGRESGWLESALRIATVLTFGDFGKTINYKGDHKFNVQDLLNKKVIMELNSLGNVEKKFFCEFILNYIYKMKKASQNDASGKFDHAIIVDEAHNIFLNKPTNFSNESVTDMIYREMREYGTSLVCLDQHFSKLSDTVKGNSACHISFQQQLPQDILEISNLMQLQEKRHYFSNLQVGEAIVKLSERYTSPFLVKVPFAKLRSERISTEEVKSRMKSMVMNNDYEKKVDPEFNTQIEKPKIQEIKKESYEVVEGFTQLQQALYNFVMKSLASGATLDKIERILENNKNKGNYNYESKDVMKVINKAFENSLVVTLKKPQIHQEKIESNKYTVENTDQQVFIEFLQKHPTHTFSTVELYKQIGLSPRKGTVVKKQLESQGLITTEEIRYNKGWKKIIRLNN